MIKKTSLVLMMFVAGSLSFFCAAFAADLSADMISTAGGKSFKGKIFISGNKIRMETPDSVSITRMDKKAVWIIMPKEKMYMEQPFDPSKTTGISEKVEGELERKLLGKENIDGRQAEKYQVVFSANRKKEIMFQWIVPGLSLPVKSAAADNSWKMEYKNIKTGKQPDSLFEIPAGYQKMGAVMPSMKDMLKGFGR